MVEVKVLQNVHCEDLGFIHPILKSCGFDPRYVQSYAGEAVPQGFFSGLGGPGRVGRELIYVVQLWEREDLCDCAIK